VTISLLQQLRQVFGAVRAVLFDFDGPLCDVFAGLPARGIARQLEAIVERRYPTDDPLEVLSLSSQLGADTVSVVESALIRAELDAVARAKPNSEGLTAVQACLSAGLEVGVVSNNSGEAVTAFLKSAGLVQYIAPIVGREPGRPDLMKPNPWPLQQALTSLACRPEDAVFIGDSTTDIDVANALGVHIVAYANKPGKRQRFTDAGAIVIDSMSELVAAVSPA